MMVAGMAAHTDIQKAHEVANEIDLPVPLPYHVDTSETGVPFVLLIEDIQGATTPDQIAGLNADEVMRIKVAVRSGK